MCVFSCRYFGKHDPIHSEYQMISNTFKVRREGGRKEGRKGGREGGREGGRANTSTQQLDSTILRVYSQSTSLAIYSKNFQNGEKCLLIL